MSKIYNLQITEEITSVVERLWETGASRVYFVVPDESPLVRNIVGLRLLKREADRLGKTVILVTKEAVGREMAKRAGLLSRVTLPKTAQEEQKFLEDDTSDDSGNEEVLKEVPQQEYQSFLDEQVKLKRESGTASQSLMSDIRFNKPDRTEKPDLPRPELPAKPEFSKPDLTKPDLAEPDLTEEKFFAAEKPSGMPAFLAESKKPKIEGEKENLTPFMRKLMEREGSDELDRFLLKKEEPEKQIFSDQEFSRFSRKTDLEKETEGAKKLKEPSTFSPFKFFSIFITVALLVGAAVLYFILPKADIVIEPRSETLSQDLTVVADKGMAKVDVAQSKIPAQLIKLDQKQTKEFAATGQRQMNDKAHGVITVYNEFSSASQGLVQSTRFVTDDGKVFRLVKSITVPGAKIEEGKIVASSIDAEVVADQPGATYNIGPSNFKIPGFEGSPKYIAFYGKSKNAMTGGAIGVAKVVSADDFNNAKAAIWRDLQPEIDKTLKAQIPSGLKAVGNSIKEEISSVDSTVQVAGQADKFSLTVKGTASALLFSEADVYQLAASKLTEDLGSDKVLSPGGSQIEYSSVTVDFGRSQITFKAKVNEYIVWKVDTEGLKRLTAGKNEEQIKQVLSQRSEIDKARIVFWPFWVKSVPGNLDKINIKISGN